MTNTEVAKYTLDALKKAGAEHAQCIVSRGKVDELNVESNDFSLLRSLFTSALSIKALVGGKKGSTGTNRLDTESIDRAVADCIAAAESSVADEAEQIAPLTQNADFAAGITEPDRDALFDRLQEFLTQTAGDYPKVTMENVVAKYDQRDSLYANSNGAQFCYTRGKYGFYAGFCAQEGDLTSSSSGFGCALETLDKPFLDIGIHKTLLEDSEKQIVTVPFDGKTVGTVVLMPDCLGEFLESIVYVLMRDGALLDGTSPWKDSLGKAVAHPGFTLSTIPLHEQVVCGERFTADGYACENADLIRDGVLQGFQLTQYGANKTGLARAKNSAENFAVTPGEKSLAEIIAGIDCGLLIGRFSGGYPSSNGDFSGVAKNSFLIKNGQIADAVSETMISGNLTQLLLEVSDISRETVTDGMHVLPWAAFKGVTISGK